MVFGSSSEAEGTRLTQLTRGPLGIACRAVAIVVGTMVVACIVNTFSPRAIPWIYRGLAPDPRPLIFLIGETEAHELFLGEETIFVDVRNSGDFAWSHIKGSVSLSALEMAVGFAAVENLLPQDARIIVYGRGPGHDLAEKVAIFHSQLGYNSLFIMKAGFRAWERPGYPVEGDCYGSFQWEGS